MRLIFKWYFDYAGIQAIKGEESDKVNYKVYCGSAMGAFNQWVKGTRLEKWENRHVDEIAIKIMHDTAVLLNKSFKKLTTL